MPRTSSWIHGATLVVCALLLLLAAGCGGGGGSKVLYVVGPGTPSAVVLNIASSGGLTVDPNPAGTGANPVSIVVDPQTKFAYVADGALGLVPGGISQYNVAKNGQLSAITNSTSTTAVGQALPPVAAGTYPIAMAINGNGTLLFVANQVSNDVSVYAVDRSLGTLTQVSGSPFAAGKAPAGIALAGSTVFVSNSGEGTISAFSFDSTGSLKAVSGSPFQAGVSPTGLAVTTDGKYLYAADQAGNAVLGFTIGSGGTLTAVSGSPFAAGTKPVGIATDASDFVFVANSGSNNVSMFSVGSGGTLSAASGSPFAAGSGPSFVTTDSTGSFLFVANAGDGTVSSFAIKSGSLTKVDGSPFASHVGGPVWMTSIH